MSQVDIKMLIQKELSGDNEMLQDHLPGSFRDDIPGLLQNETSRYRQDGFNGFIPDDLTFSDRFKTYNDEPVMLKSSQEDFGDTPDWFWVKQFGGTSADIGRAITSDAMGNIYAAGTFSGIMIIGEDTLESTGTEDMVIMKLSQTCYPLWFTHVPAPEGEFITPESILLDNAGNIIVTGYFHASSITIGGTVLTRTGEQDIFITKLNNSGNITWAKSYGESERVFSQSKVRADASNNYYLICSQGYFHTAIVKYSASGQLLLNLPKTNCKYSDIEIYNTSIYLTGSIEGYAEFGSTILMPNRRALFLGKCDLDGNFLWAITTTYPMGYGASGAFDIAIDNNENIYLTGYLVQAVWGNDTIEDYIPAFISKVSPAGQIAWTKYSDMDGFTFHEFRKLFADNQNNIYIYGYTGDTITYEGKEIFPPYFILKCNSDGLGLQSVTLDFNPLYIDRYGADKTISAGTDSYGNLIVSRYNSSAIKEYSTNFKSNSGSGSISGMETDENTCLYSYGGLNGNVEIFGNNLQNFNGIFVCKHNSRGDLLWIRFIKGAGFQSGNAFILNRDQDCLFLFGYINDTVEIGAEKLIPSDGNQFLAKCSSEGVFEWALPIKNESWQTPSLSTDNLGNAILSGCYGSGLTIGDTTLAGPGDYNINAYVAKFDVNGVFKWIITITNAHNDARIGINSTDENNMIYFTGEFLPGDINFNGNIINTEGESEGNILFAKLNPDGIPLWIRTLGNGNFRNNAHLKGLVTDAEGYSYIHGRFNDSVYFDDILLTKPYNIPDGPTYNYNYFILRVNPDSYPVWAKSVYNRQYLIFPNEIGLDDAGSIYMMGSFRDTLIFGNDYTLPNIGYSDMFIVKYYSDGELAWIKSIETTTDQNEFRSLAVYDSMSLYAGGYFNNEAFFDPFTLNSPGQANGFIALLNKEKLNCMDVTGSCSDYICTGKNDGYIDITITGGIPPYTYEWSNGAVSEDLENLTPGEYTVTVIDSRLCIVKETFVLDSARIYQGSELCMVSVNNNNKIILVWEKAYDKHIASYRLYREKTKDNYVQIAEVPFENLSVYVDEGSAPDEYSHFYKIKAVDVCGDSSEFSPHHKSIHLWSALGVSGEVTLTWDEYEGFDYDQYIIYRGSSLDALNEIKRISSSSKSWTDPSPPVGQVFYRVRVVKEVSCFPTSNKAEEYGSTVSNYDEETIELIEPASGQSITIFPNPFKDKTRITFSNPDHSPYQTVITDLAGKVVRTESGITTGEFELERGNLPAGIYLVEIRGERICRGKVVVQ
jgi:hypothetical protein